MKIHLPEDTFHLSKPEGASDLVIGDLSPFLRATLLTDGTLTNLLSSLLNEAIIASPTLSACAVYDHPSEYSKISWIFNHPYTLFYYFSVSDKTERMQPLAAANVPKALELRAACLLTEESQQLVAITHSVLASHRLPASFAATLVNTPAGLGQALRNEKIEHFRMLFWYGALPVKCLIPHLGNHQLPDNMKLLPARAYGLFIQQKLVMTIAECFVHPLFSVQ